MMRLDRPCFDWSGLVIFGQASRSIIPARPASGEGRNHSHRRHDGFRARGLRARPGTKPAAAWVDDEKRDTASVGARSAFSPPWLERNPLRLNRDFAPSIYSVA